MEWRVTKVSKNENDKEIIKKIPKERYISPEQRQKIIDDPKPTIIV